MWCRKRKKKVRANTDNAGGNAKCLGCELPNTEGRLSKDEIKYNI